MTAKLFCDKCGKEITEEKEGHYEASLYFTPKEGGGDSETVQALDLCRKCAKAGVTLNAGALA